MDQEKRVKFEELAEKRVNEVIKKLRILGNLSNKKNYDFEERHLKQVFDALDAEMKNLKDRFQQQSGRGTTFKFK